MPRTDAVNSFGTILRRNGIAIASVQDIAGPGMTTEVDDITNHSSPGAVREKVPTLIDGGELTFGLIFNFSDPTHDHFSGLEYAQRNRLIEPYELEYPDGSGYSFDAFVTGMPKSAPVAGHLSADCTLTLAGEPIPQHSFTS